VFRYVSASWFHTNLTGAHRTATNNSLGRRASGVISRTVWKAVLDISPQQIVLRTDPWHSSARHARNPESIFRKIGRQNTLRRLLFPHLIFTEYITCCRNQLIRTFIMDGNFSAEHMRHRSGDRDVSLSAGTTFMANPESFQAHLQSGQEILQVRSNSGSQMV